MELNHGTAGHALLMGSFQQWGIQAGRKYYIIENILKFSKVKTKQ
jgi:hypothetical protein